MTTVAEPIPGWDDYWRGLAEGEPGPAVDVALALHDRGMSLVNIVDRLVAPAQVEVGRLWADNEWNVAQEHRATSVSEAVVAALARVAAPSNPRGVAVVTCVDGEWHSLPARLVAAVLTGGGWRVHYLGASLPVQHLAQLLQDLGPDVTGLSCSVPTALPRARAMIEASRDAGIPVMVGGRGFGPDGRWGRWLGANAAAATAGQALELLSSPTWPRFTDPAPPLPVQDGSIAALSRHHSRIVAAAYRNLEGRWPSMRDYNAYQLARTEEDLGYLVDFLSVALYVDDPDLYLDFIGWMVKILSSRGVPPQALRAGLVGVAEALQQLVGDAERPQRFLAAAVEVVNRSGSAS